MTLSFVSRMKQGQSAPVHGTRQTTARAVCADGASILPGRRPSGAGERARTSDSLDKAQSHFWVCATADFFGRLAGSTTAELPPLLSPSSLFATTASGIECRRYNGASYRSTVVPIVCRTDQGRREKIAFATLPIASTRSPQSEKQMMRQGHASRPS
jgi:hypothetical protein